MFDEWQAKEYRAFEKKLDGLRKKSKVEVKVTEGRADLGKSGSEAVVEANADLSSGGGGEGAGSGSKTFVDEVGGIGELGLGLDWHSSAGVCV